MHMGFWPPDFYEHASSEIHLLQQIVRGNHLDHIHLQSALSRRRESCLIPPVKRVGLLSHQGDHWVRRSIKGGSRTLGQFERSEAVLRTSAQRRQNGIFVLGEVVRGSFEVFGHLPDGWDAFVLQEGKDVIRVEPALGLAVKPACFVFLVELQTSGGHADGPLPVSEELAAQPFELPACPLVGSLRGAEARE